MNGLPYYKAYPRDFIEATVGFSFEVKCAYRVIIDLIYMHGGRLRDDDRYISGQLGCSIRKWKSIRNQLIEIDKLNISQGFLSNNRADKELESLSKLQEKQRENAYCRNKNNDLQKPWQSHTEPDTYKDKRDTKVSQKNEHESEFENQFWPVYPRKVSKGAALKAFKAARKKSDLETILSGAIRFAKARQGEDANFTKHAASWLNAECWKDEPDPPPRIGSSRPNGRPLNAADAMREKWRNDAENGSRDSRDVELLSSDQSGSAAFDWLDYKALPGSVRSGDH